MHHRVHLPWTDRNGNICLSWNILKKLFGASLHAVHEGVGMFAVHVVHYIEVAHFIIGSTTAEDMEQKQHSLCPKRNVWNLNIKCTLKKQVSRTHPI